MLSLTRKKGESVVLVTETGEPIYIQLLDIPDINHARISIEAPKSVEILRGERYPHHKPLTIEPNEIDWDEPLLAV